MPHPSQTLRSSSFGSWGSMTVSAGYGFGAKVMFACEVTFSGHGSHGSGRTSRGERSHYVPAVRGSDGACHLGGAWAHRRSLSTADRFSDRVAPADTIPAFRDLLLAPRRHTLAASGQRA